VSQLLKEEFSAESAAKARLDFAERLFINAQELSRFMDQKASFLLYAVALMTSALGIVAAKSLDAQPEIGWQVTLKVVALFSFLTYVLIAFVVVYNATRVFKALPPRLISNSKAPGLIFPLTLLERYHGSEEDSEERYFSQLNTVSPSDILRDYAQQILEISHIYSGKQRQINISTRLFQYLSVWWIVAMLLLLATAFIVPS
jgi:hypothetical protein